MASPDLIAARERFRQLRHADLFSGSARQTVGEAMEPTVQSLQAYGPSHRHWAVAWSCGKDATATLTRLVAMIRGGNVPPPEPLTQFRADTWLEVPRVWAVGPASMNA